MKEKSFIAMCAFERSEKGMKLIMDKTIIETKNVCKTYHFAKTKVEALKNVSFKINTGELTVITGYSGSGKTTLLNAVSSLIEIDSGTILVNNKDITKFNEIEKNKYRQNDISIIFQNYNLLSDLTVYENVLLGSKIGKNNCNIDELLEMVNLQDRKNNYPNELSGGEQQRASIARSIAKGGKIYLCDEPTGALDVENGKVVLKYLKNIAKEADKAVIVITHNNLVTLSADHVIVMEDGRIIEDKYNENPLDIDEVGW